MGLKNFSDELLVVEAKNGNKLAEIELHNRLEKRKKYLALTFLENGYYLLSFADVDFAFSVSFTEAYRYYEESKGSFSNFFTVIYKHNLFKEAAKNRSRFNPYNLASLDDKLGDGTDKCLHDYEYSSSDLIENQPCLLWGQLQNALEKEFNDGDEVGFKLLELLTNGVSKRKAIAYLDITQTTLNRLIKKIKKTAKNIFGFDAIGIDEDEEED